MRTPWGHRSGAPCGIVVDRSGCVYCANGSSAHLRARWSRVSHWVTLGAPLGVWHSQSLSGREACKPVARPALCPTGSALGGPSVRVLMWPLAPSPPWEGAQIITASHLKLPYPREGTRCGYRLNNLSKFMYANNHYTMQPPISKDPALIL